MVACRLVQAADDCRSLEAVDHRASHRGYLDLANTHRCNYGYVVMQKHVKKKLYRITTYADTTMIRHAKIYTRQL